MGIIGVVAALTIPNLMQNTRNKELVSSYLKMHTTLSNAFKETEAVNGMYVKKMDEQTFKELFESHLKKLSTCEDYDVCLTDGSKFNYGTYNEGCPTGTCTELTIDTNGNRMPNKSGKDIFTMLVTDRGIKALGESNMCETGLDCGAYILANHKLYDGTVDEVAPPEHEPEPPKEPTPEELAQAAYEQCKSEKGASACYSECKSANSATCTLANGVEVNKFGDRYVSYDKTPVNFNTAVSSCEQKGMQMLSKTMFDDMYSKDKDFIKNNYNGDIWLSDAYSGDHESCVRIGDCHYYVIERGDEYIYSDNHFNHGTFTKSVICVAD